MSKLKIGILISGRGSNMSAILDAIDTGDLDAECCVVISNKPTAKGLEIAQEKGIETQSFEPNNYNSKADYEYEIVKVLQESGVELLVLAGYMRLVGNTILDAYADKMMNIHPSLLPAFKGLKAQQQALEYGVKITGCTVHFVTKDMDAGPVILQAIVPIKPDDNVDTLSNRILTEEHRIYVEAIQLYSEGRLKIVDRGVVIT